MLSRVLGIELAATCIVVAGNDGQHEHICWWNVSFFFWGGKSKFLVIRPNVWQSNSRVLLMKYRSVPGVFLLRVFCDEPKTQVTPSYQKFCWFKLISGTGQSRLSLGRSLFFQQIRETDRDIRLSTLVGHMVISKIWWSSVAADPFDIICSKLLMDHQEFTWISDRIMDNPAIY